MKKKIKFLIVIPLLVLSKGVLADSISIEPMQKISSQVSTNDPNVVSVYNDKIISVTANSGNILSNNKTNDGKIVFTTKATKSFNMVIETETGFTFTLIAQPSSHFNGASLTVYNKQAKGNDEAINFETDKESYSGLITDSLTQVMRGKSPKGFVETQSATHNLPTNITQYLDVKGINSWNGHNYIIQQFNVTNRTVQPIELNERYLWEQGVMAVSFTPNITVLKPNMSITAYVVRKGVK
ncbi:TraK domain-containing protein [Providencia hangzhouensis]